MPPESGAIPVIAPGVPLPDPLHARPDGLVAVGGGLGVERLREAYRKGLFPWSDNPETWWCPDPRAVIDLNEGLRLSRRTQQKLRQGRFRITYDQAFADVVRACAEPRKSDDSTWISPALARAYVDLHQAGDAHSLEVWDGAELVGGIYGVAVGGAFSGESMFNRVPDAAKIALAELTERLREWGFELFDAQVLNPFTASLGVKEIPRREYLGRLETSLAAGATFGGTSSSRGCGDGRS